METKGLDGRMSNLSSAGSMLGLELPSHSQNPDHRPHLEQPPQANQTQMVAFSHREADYQQAQPQLPVRKTYSFMPKSSQQNEPRVNNDDDEPGCANDDASPGGKRNTSPWQRMKWTDNMVRLLITVVYYIGDEVGSEGNEKKKSAGLLQKKGKWKSVSQAMLEKGFYVSPQQCEDKFNDLNKRYKRVVDIFGRGTACQVVENQSLLDTVDLPSKTKEEAKKLLNSKHLFFREMCAYHTSCGHGGGSGSGGAAVSSGGSGMHQSPEVMAAQHSNPPQQHCFHATENRSLLPGLDPVATEGSSRLMMMGVSGEDDENDWENGDDKEEDREDNECQEWDPRDSGARKTGSEVSMPSPVMRRFSNEVLTVLQDGLKSPVEKKQWIMVRLMQIEEQRIKCQYEAFHIEKQRLKWLKFSGKKQREMDRMKLDIERRRLENERMMILLRQKELELFNQQHAQNPC